MWALKILIFGELLGIVCIGILILGGMSGSATAQVGLKCYDSLGTIGVTKWDFVG